MKDYFGRELKVGDVVAYIEFGVIYTAVVTAIYRNDIHIKDSETGRNTVEPANWLIKRDP